MTASFPPPRFETASRWPKSRQLERPEKLEVPVVYVGGRKHLPAHAWTFELGCNQWVWGESARRHIEPYASISRSF